jgi:hypothetical protein
MFDRWASGDEDDDSELDDEEDEDDDEEDEDDNEDEDEEDDDEDDDDSDDGEEDESKWKKTVPDGCPWLQKAADRWGLQPPYVVHTDRQWQSYYEERAALEWRHESAWDDAGEELSAKATAAKWAGARAAAVGASKEPRRAMRPICTESYADYNDTTTRAQYDGFMSSMRRRVQIALSPAPPPASSGDAGEGGGQSGQMGELAKAAAAGCFILQYWVNYEDRDCVRSTEFETRLYAPVGTGASFDFYYRWHFRARSFGAEQYLNCYSIDREINSACAVDPTAAMSSWKPANGSWRVHREPGSWRLINQSDGKKGRLAKRSSLRGFTRRLLGGSVQAIAKLQAFHVAVGASGAGAAGETSSWIARRGEELFGQGK